MRRPVVLVLVLVASFAGCIPFAPEEPRHVVRIGDREWDLLLAGRDGMRHRDDFGGADGMLFDMDQDVDPGAVVFVMDGVRFPLDIAWFTETGALVGVASMAPCPSEPCPTYASPGRFRWAVEAPAGALGDVDAEDRLEVSPSGAGG